MKSEEEISEQIKALQLRINKSNSELDKRVAYSMATTLNWIIKDDRLPSEAVVIHVDWIRNSI
jgi:hypothetical protein